MVTDPHGYMEEVLTLEPGAWKSSGPAATATTAGCGPTPPPSRREPPDVFPMATANESEVLA